MNYIQLTNEKLNIEKLSELATSPKCGAISVFVGTTRNNFEDKKVLRLEYEAYDSMALKSLEQICQEMRCQWPNVENIVIYHRLGAVPVKEASIVIAISSPHRMDALQATEWCIDIVKTKVPIWKKEIYDSSAAEWKENKEFAPHPPKLKKFKLDFEPEVAVPNISPHLIQIRASNADLNKRINSFMERKRKEIDINNIQEFCKSDRNQEFTCARVDTVLQKRKDSKGHLQVSRVLNTYSRDQVNSAYLTKHMPLNGIEERIQNLEFQLSMSAPVPTNIYARLKKLEDQMLYLESVSPEYINFWDKTHFTNKLTKKKVFTVQEIDSLIAELEKKTVQETKM